MTTMMINPARHAGMPVKFRFSEAERLVFKPRERLSVSEWAEKYREIVKGPKQGRWENAYTPYLTGIMDAWNMISVKKIVVMAPPQTGKTQAAFNCLMYAMDIDPGPALYVMPDEKVAKRIAKRQIIPTLKSTRKIANLLSDREKDVPSLYVKLKNGMDLSLAWATSPAALASESIRYVFLDEPSVYPKFAGKEASPFDLAEMRTNAYPHDKKIMIFSTPALEEDDFTDIFRNADVHYEFHVPCHVCGHEQIMLFDNISFGGSRDGSAARRMKLARYNCVNCGFEWDDAQKNRNVRKGRYVADREVERPESVAFHYPAWISPFISLSDSAAAFLEGLKDPGKMMHFVNKHKAEAWKETVASKSEEAVMALRNELPRGIVPAGFVALTAGVDVQKDSFWFVVRAWDRDLNSHLVDYGQLTTWAELETQLFEAGYRVQGTETVMKVWRAAIDTGGGVTEDNEWTRTEEIYHWVRYHSRGICFATKGASRPQLTRVKYSKIDRFPRKDVPIPGGLELRILDSHQFKALIHWRMERGKEESQHFSLNAETGLDYVRQLLAEELQRGRNNQTSWKKIRRDNHLLDCECLAAACADNEWAPSLKLIAHSMPVENENRGSVYAEKTQPHTEQQRALPGWFNRR